MNADHVLRRLSVDLPEADLLLVKKHLLPLSKIKTIKEQYKELTNICNSKIQIHPQWALLSGRIRMEGIKRDVPDKFSEAMQMIKIQLDKDFYDFVLKYKTILDDFVVEARNFNFDIFATETWIKSYLLKNNGVVIESPQYVYMRVATFWWFQKNSSNIDFQRIKQAYEDLSLGHYSCASPTLFNAGKKNPQLASCFVMNVSDSMGSITKNWKDIAFISKNSGGIGVEMPLRHSEIESEGGEASKGVVPWIKIVDNILTTVDQGGKRKGSGAIYLPVWHYDIEEFLDLKKANGPEDLRARNCFYGITIPDEFMRRVENNESWMLMCPNKAKTLDKVWGIEFEMAYSALESVFSKNKTSFTRQVSARELWKKIVTTQMEVGMPYMIYIDACNRKSNQKNIGKIRLSNLCTEIMLFTDKDNISSCTLGSIVLDSCIENENGNIKYNYEKLDKLARDLTRNLNQTIDRTYYPPEIPEIKYTNMRTRPLGIGIVALADTFAKMDLIWDSSEARKLNRDIMETIYYATTSESVEMAKERGYYELFPGSPASKGQFQFDLWEEERREKEIINRSKFGVSVNNYEIIDTNKYSRYTMEEWEELRSDMMKFGLLNSQLCSLMPTATTANLLGKNECFEPFTHLMGTRRVLSGEFVITNKYLVDDLQKIGLWNTAALKELWRNRGRITELSDAGLEESQKVQLEHIKKKYKTVFEMDQKLLSDFCLDRGEFVCQSQSFNCWMSKPTYRALTSFHFYNWNKGAKTGMYYLRREAAADPNNFSLDNLKIPERPQKTRIICTDEVCLSCNC